MALASMTGFGRKEGTVGTIPVSVEIRTVNNRFLEINCRLPKQLASLEYTIREAVRGRISRGSVFCSVNLGQGVDRNPVPTGYNEHLVSEYIRIALEIKDRFGLAGEPRLEQLLTLPDLMLYEDPSGDQELITRQILFLVDAAIEDCLTMRVREGENLRDDLEVRVRRMEATLDTIQVLDKNRIVDYRDRMLARVQALLGEASLDPARIAQEVSIFADRADITEEIVRFHSHNQLFLEALSGAGNMGKRLNFILQEMGREANTLGTKSQHAEIAALAVSLKEEVESIREQVQNIE